MSALQILDFIPSLTTGMISLGLEKAIIQLEKLCSIQKFNKKGSLFSKWKKRIAIDKQMPSNLNNAFDKLGRFFDSHLKTG